MSYIPYTTTPTGITNDTDSNYGLSYDGNGNIWISNWDQQVISIIDVNSPYTPTVISSTSFYYALTNPDSIIYDYVNNNMWITDDLNYIVVIVSAISPYTLKNTLTVGGAASIAFDGTYMWILYEYNSSVTIVNATTFTITADIDLSSYITSVSGIGFDGTYMWIFNNNNTNITLYTASTQTYHSTLTNDYEFINKAGNTYYCYYQDNNMWITSAWGNVLSIVNTTTYDLISSYSGSVYGISGTSGIGYDPINNKIWIIDWYYSLTAYILNNITNPITDYSVKVNGVDTDLSLIFKSIGLGTKSSITTDYNVSGYGDLNNIFAALNGGTPLTYNTLYTWAVEYINL
jgi:hypothetical protein